MKLNFQSNQTLKKIAKGFTIVSATSVFLLTGCSNESQVLKNDPTVEKDEHMKSYMTSDQEVRFVKETDADLPLVFEKTTDSASPKVFLAGKNGQRLTSDYHKIENLYDEMISIAPEMKESMNRFGAKNAYQDCFLATNYESLKKEDGVSIYPVTTILDKNGNSLLRFNGELSKEQPMNIEGMERNPFVVKFERANRDEDDLNPHFCYHVGTNRYTAPFDFEASSMVSNPSLMENGWEEITSYLVQDIEGENFTHYYDADLKSIGILPLDSKLTSKELFEMIQDQTLDLYNVKYMNQGVVLEETGKVR